MADDIEAIVATGIAAIEKAADLVGKRNSGIDSEQIMRLRNAIDQLEAKLNEKKRKLDADQS